MRSRRTLLDEAEVATARANPQCHDEREMSIKSSPGFFCLLYAFLGWHSLLVDSEPVPSSRLAM
jgi:hypothetical protein